MTAGLLLEAKETKSCCLLACQLSVFVLTQQLARFVQIVDCHISDQIIHDLGLLVRNGQKILTSAMEILRLGSFMICFL